MWRYLKKLSLKYIVISIKETPLTSHVIISVTMWKQNNSPLPPSPLCQIDPEYLEEQERVRLADQRRRKQHIMFTKQKSKFLLSQLIFNLNPDPSFLSDTGWYFKFYKLTLKFLFLLSNFKSNCKLLKHLYKKIIYVVIYYLIIKIYKSISIYNIEGIKFKLLILLLKVQIIYI